MKILKKELDKLVWLGSTICENPILLINLLGTNTQFSIQDNGKGLSVDFAIDERSSLGVKLVSSLIAQLGAELKVKSGEGTTFVFTFQREAVRGSASTLEYA